MSIVQGTVRGAAIYTWFFLEGLESCLFEVGMWRSIGRGNMGKHSKSTPKTIPRVRLMITLECKIYAIIED